MDHCRIVLRALAHFHAYSTIIQRDSEEPLLDLWPFAVEASNFREVWAARMRPVKEQVSGWSSAVYYIGFTTGFHNHGEGPY